MDRTVYWVALIDAILVASFAYVYQDLQWRVGYAQSPHSACLHLCSYTASFSLGPLTRVFTMVGNGATLAGPLTLDWIQVLAILLVVVNAWFAFSLIRGRRRAPLQAG